MRNNIQSLLSKGANGIFLDSKLPCTLLLIKIVQFTYFSKSLYNLFFVYIPYEHSLLGCCSTKTIDISCKC